MTANIPGWSKLVKSWKTTPLKPTLRREEIDHGLQILLKLSAKSTHLGTKAADILAVKTADGAIHPDLCRQANTSY